jgi:hypothetical protein
MRPSARAETRYGRRLLRRAALRTSNRYRFGNALEFPPRKLSKIKDIAAGNILKRLMLLK